MLRTPAGQMTLTGFKTPFGEGLDKNNRWVKLAAEIPWDGLCAAYENKMSGGQGRPAKPARVVIGAVIVKHKLKLSDDEPPPHQGEMIVDATVVEQGIKYPTDPQLLNEAREISETIVDKLYPETATQKKPRTYREKARRTYLRYAKKRKHTQKDHQRAVKQQLQYLKRNLGHIATLLDALPDQKIPLGRDLLRKYWVIQQLFSQQREMHRSGERSHPDRIVSIGQPQVRPMVRGKAKKPVEFGSKLSVSLNDNAIATIDRLSWDAYHEARDLPKQVEGYKERHGHWPQVVLADGLYGTRENREWLQERGIRFGGKALGRPPKDETKQKERARQLRRDELARIPIEGKFGQVKAGYRLDRVAAGTKATAEAWIRATFLVVNLVALSRALLRLFIDGVRRFENWLAAKLLLPSGVFPPQLTNRWATF